MNTLLVRACSAACIVVLAACSILPKSDPVAVYRLPATASPLPSPAPGNPAAYRALRINTPYASRTIDSERILVLPAGDVVKSYAAVRWSDPAPVLMRDRLLEAFAADGRFGALSGDNANIAADIELNGSLVAFQTEYRNGAPVVVIEFDARIIDATTRQQLAARRFSIARPATGEKVPEVVTSFGAAIEDLSSRIVPWVAGLPKAQATMKKQD